MELLTIIACFLIFAFVFWKVVKFLGNICAMIFGFIYVISFVEIEKRQIWMGEYSRQIWK